MITGKFKSEWHPINNNLIQYIVKSHVQLIVWSMEPCVIFTLLQLQTVLPYLELNQLYMYLMRDSMNNFFEFAQS